MIGYQFNISGKKNLTYNFKGKFPVKHSEIHPLLKHIEFLNVLFGIFNYTVN